MLDLSQIRYPVADPKVNILKDYPSLNTEFISDLCNSAKGNGNNLIRYIIVRYDQEIWVTQLPDDDPAQAAHEVCRSLGIVWDEISPFCEGKKFAAAINDYLILTQSMQWANLIAFMSLRTQVLLDAHDPKLKPGEKKTTLQSLREIDDMVDRMKQLMRSMFHDEYELVDEAKNRMTREIRGFIMSNIAEMERE